MNKGIEINVLQTELTRLQSLVSIADKKITFLFILYSIIFGFYFQDIGILSTVVEEKSNILITSLITTIFIYGLYSIYMGLSPKLGNGNEKPLLFFGYISTLSLGDFKKKMSLLDEKQMKEELVEQIHTLSVINNNKMNSIKRIISALILMLFLTFIFILMNLELFLGKQ